MLEYFGQITLNSSCIIHIDILFTFSNLFLWLVKFYYPVPTHYNVYLRWLHLFPFHADGQSQLPGLTHFPLFIHNGSQTPTVREKNPSNIKRQLSLHCTSDIVGPLRSLPPPCGTRCLSVKLAFIKMLKTVNIKVIKPVL